MSLLQLGDSKSTDSFIAEDDSGNGTLVDTDSNSSENTVPLPSLLIVDSTESVHFSDMELRIQQMRDSGRGSVDKPHEVPRCVLEVRMSGLFRSGFGVWLRDGVMIHNGECVTEFCGERVLDESTLIDLEKLYTVKVNDVVILGWQGTKKGDGLGSMLNSAVEGRCLPNVRFGELGGHIFLFADVPDR